ncbi:MAG TPA: hypothetical protein VMH92_06240 [Acidocella sp.]|nr:hypothetical protein [Acidocella sp.]
MTLDWRTLLLQTVNVVILIWLLKKFFWQPVAGMIEQRRGAVLTQLNLAKAKQDAATAALAGIEQTRAGFAQERAAVLAAAQEEAGQLREAVLKNAAEAATALEAAAQARIAAAQQAGAAAWRAQAGQLALEIAAQLAARLDGAAVRSAFLDGLVKEIEALPPALRPAPEGGTLELCSATALSPEEQEACRQRLAAALADVSALSFTTDPALIAGLELHGANLLVRNSWRADLDRIQARLGHE